MLLKINAFCFSFVLLTSLVRAQPEFVENKGQWPSQVLFKTELGAGTMWTEQQGLTYQIFDPAELQRMHVSEQAPVLDGLHGHAYKILFVGALDAAGVGREKKPQYHNYYLSNNPEQHAANCGVYERAQLQHVYAGIDVQVYAAGGHLKYDWIVQPGSDPRTIRLQIDGAEWSLKKSTEGIEVCIETSLQKIIEKQPVAYQIIGGRMVDVECNYVMREGMLSYAVGTYNHDYTLVIDPEVAFSTFIGSPANSWGFTACDDSQGNLIAGAAVFANNYPTTTGAFYTQFNSASTNHIDIGLSKFSQDGTQLLYSTYIGGDMQETPHSVVVDSQDRIILFGVTGSANYPTQPGAYQFDFVGGPYLSMSSFFTSTHPNGTDLFVTKFDSNGALLASTFIGGTDNDGLLNIDQLFYNYGDTFRGEVNVDASDNVYVSTVTRSQDFPVTSGAFGGGLCDGVLFKLSPSLNSLMRSIYVGGNGSDACYVVELNDAGQIIIAGGTQSSNFPLVPATAADATWNGETDGFIALLNPTTFAVQGGTFVGTSVYDQVYFAQSDNSGNIYAYGQTEGDMPITAGLYGQPNSGQFISKFNPQLSAMLWNTTVGTSSGAIDISPTAFMVSDCEQIYFSGWGGDVNTNFCSGNIGDCYATQSTTFGLPITSDAFQSVTDGSDFYLGVLQPNASGLLYGSYLGGPESNEHVDGGTSRFDKNGSVYHAVCAGCQNNDDFPTTPGAWSNTNESTGCNLAVFRFDLSAIQAQVEIDGPDQVCVGETVAFNNLTIGATTYQWNFGDGTTSDLMEPDHQYTDGGLYTIELIGSDNALCVTSDTATVQVEVIPNVEPTVQDSAVICVGENTQLQASGSANLHWLANSSLSALNVPNPVATPATTTTYYVVDENVCYAETLSVVVEVSSVDISISNDTTLCVGQSTQLEASGGATYLWSPATYLNDATLAAPSCAPLASIDYSVTVTNEHGCVDQTTLSISVFDTAPGGQAYTDVTLCEGESVQLMALAGSAWSWSPAFSLNNSAVQAPMASPADTTRYSVAITNACGQGVDEVIVNVIHPRVEASDGGSICTGDSIAASATGASTYAWRPAASASPNDGATVILTPTSTTTFEVTGTDAFNCNSTDTVLVFVYPTADIEAGPDAYFNAPDSVRLYGNALGFQCYWWPSDGLSCDSCEQPMASPIIPTVYHLAIVDDFGCVNDDSVYVQPYYPVYVPNAFTPNDDGINDVFMVRGNDITGFHLMIFNRWGLLVFESFDITKPWVGDAVDAYYAPNDVYNWVLEFDSLDRTTLLKGHVTLAR